MGKFLGDTKSRDINLHLEYYSKPRKEGEEVSRKELSDTEKANKVLHLNKIKVRQIIDRLTVILSAITNRFAC